MYNITLLTHHWGSLKSNKCTSTFTWTCKYPPNLHHKPVGECWETFSCRAGPLSSVLYQAGWHFAPHRGEWGSEGVHRPPPLSAYLQILWLAPQCEAKRGLKTNKKYTYRSLLLKYGYLQESINLINKATRNFKFLWYSIKVLHWSWPIHDQYISPLNQNAVNLNQ